MNETTSYEFAPAFRGDHYEWYPEPIEDAQGLQPVLVSCLRNEIREFRVELAAGSAWFIRWVPMSRSQVRGGALRIDACEPDPPEPAEQVELAELRKVVVGSLLDERPWRLTRRLWAALSSPDPTLAAMLEQTGQRTPRFALLADEPEALDVLAGLPIGPEFAVLRDEVETPEPLVDLYLEWHEGKGWLSERIGVASERGLIGLDPVHQRRTLELFGELCELGSGVVEGWDAVERSLDILDDLASELTGRGPDWTVEPSAGLSAPKVDLRAGIIGLPAHDSSRRARELARRLRVEALLDQAGPSSDPDDTSSRRYGPRALAVVFGLGLGLGLGLGYLLSIR